MVEQPGSRKLPASMSRSDRDSETFRSLRYGQSRIEAEPDQFLGHRIALGERRHRLLERQQQFRGLGIGQWTGQPPFVDGLPNHSTTSFASSFLSRSIDEYPAHRERRSTEKMPEVIPLGRVRFGTEHSQERFMDQRGRLQGLIRRLPIQFRLRELPELVVHQRKESFARESISISNSGQQSGCM